MPRGQEKMKPHKPLISGSEDVPRTGATLPEPASSPDAAAHKTRAGAIEPVPLRPRPTMQNDTEPRRGRGRLGRDVQTKLGKTLQAYFDDVVKEGVPDRFKALLQQYDESKDKGSS